jgi:hypothetical protein
MGVRVACGSNDRSMWSAVLDYDFGNFGIAESRPVGKAEARGVWVGESANKEGNCANRVFRDGTFLSNAYMQRSAGRGAPYPATQRGRNCLGFRVAKTLIGVARSTDSSSPGRIHCLWRYENDFAP